HLGNFIQNQPTDGAPGTENTEVWMGRTNTALYIVFICFDRHPELIRWHLARRENITKDDYVSVILDPFQDRQRGVEFQVNPVGVQADAAWTDINGPDYSFDQVWDSEGRVTSKGWMALIALPFRSVRFPAAGKDWGVVFWRNLPRNSENDFWPRVSANVSGVLSQEGMLRGIEGVTGSHNVQINPYALAQNEHSLDTLDPNNPYFSTRNAEATGGGEVKAVWRDAVVFDGTVNPDFSDVESDQPQFTVNQRYPVYFPELRPFFLENASYFATPMALLYTRNIIRPDVGLRVTGKLGHTNIGLLAINDREPGQTIPVGDPLYGTKAGFYVGRVSQDLGKGSNVGLMYTDEEFGGGWNRIGGIDFTWRINDHWTTLGQSVESSTQMSNPASAAAVFPGGHGAGPATDWQTQRNGHAFNLYNEYQDISKGFASLPGFFQTSNIRSEHLHATYQWFPKKSVVQSYGLETNQNVAFDHANNRVYHYTTVDPFWLLTRNIVIAPIGGQNSDTVGPQDGYPMQGNENFTENFGGFVSRGQPWGILNYNMTALRSGSVNYNPLPGAIPFLMNQETVQALISVNPLRQLTADNTYLLDRDHAVSNGQLVYETQTFRTKLNYQFTRAWSARVIVEYDTTLANPAETSLQRTKQVQTQGLLTWLPHPGTVIYVGWNNDLQNYNHTVCTTNPMGAPQRCDPNRPILARGPGYLNDGRQIFVKASYLLRF
ncbi:MAG: carbohydrate binding family 9 domain-containing protein, partial [Terracidiphilus sp.]